MQTKIMRIDSRGLIYGNPLLKPERGLYAHLSAEYSHGSINASATAYHNHIDDKITQYEIPAELTERHLTELHYKNVSSATLRGIDATLAWAMTPRLTLRSAYSLCDSRDNATRRPLPSSPRHSGVASLTWGGPVVVQAAARAMSSYSYMTTTGSQMHAGARAVWRAAASREFSNITATLKIENIFDRRTTTDPAGRQIMIGLKYNL